MENNGIIERERYQIEQIRLLDSEELQVELVGSSEDDDDDDDVASLVVGLHSYLGDVEYTNNRAGGFLEGGVVISGVPIFYLEGVVLFPEATLPLRVIQPNFIAAIEKALVDAPHTIGVVRVYRDGGGRVRFASTGTTAEIRQYRRLDDGTVNVITRGQQRFRLSRRWIDVEGAPCGDIRIIQEDVPLRMPRDVVGGRLAPLRKVRRSLGVGFVGGEMGGYGDGDDSDAMSEESFENGLSPFERRLHHSALVSSHGVDRMSDSTTSSEEDKFECVLDRVPPGKNHLDDLKAFVSVDGTETEVGIPSRGSVSQFRECQRAFLPNWVYSMYDSYCLAQKAADRWKQVVRAPSMEAFLMKPDLLSFHIASKIPVSESVRQELLEIDGISYRLRREIELLENFDRIRCKTCQALIARRSDMLVMSSEGPLGAYVNPHGFVHEVMTLHRANGLAVIGTPVKEYSWFPGYAWSIAECTTCESQMGWLFSATRKTLKPRSFWGIRSSQVSDDAT
ncbi:ubiquitin-protein ligase [Lithospermum erythrorhizon]|uniref:Protein cereblon n=1 Tax=Lithospermum erythrorhizon TaxID=34254 RepID=A0AAV3PUM4_LITER